jgi:hypothetical protein
MTKALTATQKRNLWLGLLAGPLAWATYFTAGYLFLETACRHATPIANVVGLAWPSLVIVLLTIATLLLIAYAGRYTYHWWLQADVPEYGRFMAQAGTLLSALFALIVLLTGLPVLFLPPCTFVP